jgi:hypothetical protein
LNSNLGYRILDLKFGYRLFTLCALLHTYRKTTPYALELIPSTLHLIP